MKYVGIVKLNKLFFPLNQLFIFHLWCNFTLELHLHRLDAEHFSLARIGSAQLLLELMLELHLPSCLMLQW